MDYTTLSLAANVFAQFLASSPDAKTWQMLKKNRVLEEWFIDTPTPTCEQGTMLWKRSHGEESSDTIAADFTRLFLCDEEFLKAPPYASFYLESSGETFTQESDDVQAVYDAFSFQTTCLIQEPADHIATQLEFLSLLLKSAAQSDAFAKHISQFIAIHLAPWMTSWAVDVQNNAQSLFYRGLGYHIQTYYELLIETFQPNVVPRIIHRKAS